MNICRWVSGYTTRVFCSIWCCVVYSVCNSTTTSVGTDQSISCEDDLPLDDCCSEWVCWRKSYSLLLMIVCVGIRSGWAQDGRSLHTCGCVSFVVFKSETVR